MNFKIGDRIKVSTIEDVGTVVGVAVNGCSVQWDHYTSLLWYPAYQVRLAEEPTRLSRKEIRKELEDLVSAGVYSAGAIQLQIISVAAWVVIEHPKRKEIRASLRQLSAEAYCIDKTLAERIDKIADGV
jgi:hypothetical protein